MEELTNKGSIATISRKFIRNPISVAGIFVILLALIIAIFGYLLLPDKTPWSNRQILQIAAKGPGFTTDVLYFRKNEEAVKQGFLKTMFSGRKSEFEIIPMLSYEFQSDKIVLREYTEYSDEDYFYREIRLADVQFPVVPESIVMQEDSLVRFTLINGDSLVYKLTALQEMIVKESVVRRTFLFGTDRFGRDLLSRLLLGTRISLTVGFIAVGISVIIGISLGALAGYFRGAVDSVIMWFVNVVWSVPTLLMVIALTMVIGKGYWQVFVAVGLTMWVEVARVVRGQVMVIREKEYVESARAMGFSHTRILFRHILPNCLSPVIIISAANFASAILIEAGLSFLGIGVQPPVPSWGGMVKDHYGYIIVDKAYLAFIPGIAIMLLVLAFTMAGNGLRDSMDVRRE